MGKKIYLLENVYKASLKRLTFIRENFDRVVVAFSAGKDSTLTLALTGEVFDEYSVYFWDKESNLISTAQFAERTFDALPAAATPYWFALPFKMRNALSIYEPYWYCWDETCPDKWIYQPPAKPYVYMTHNNILTGYDPERHNLYRLFGDYISEGGRYRVAVLVGLRTDESLSRFRAVTKHPQFGQDWITKTDAKNVYNAYPIYDWSFGDVWTYISRNKVPYAPVYDMMFKAGLYKRNMRISQSFCDVSKQGIPIIRMIEPESFERFMNRVAGMNSLTHIDLSEVLKKAREVDTDFLLQLYPESVRRGIERKLDKSDALQKDDPNVVRALLNNDIRLKRVNRAPKNGDAIKQRWADL
jgi:predicted phosphoadenosine phosphosulfate sulfurtransferase